MPKTTIKAAVESGRILVSDGAWGTLLYQKGMKPGECPEARNLTHFDEVKNIAAQYIAAGADMVQTNSLGGNSFKLEAYDLESLAFKINERAARASREAAGDDIWVIASMGPTGKMLIMEDIDEDEMYQSFKEQAIALETGGADAICIETMCDITEACVAVRAVKENTKLEIICTFTFERTVRGDYRTIMGANPVNAADAALEAGADIVGANCGNGITEMIAIVKEMRYATDAPILVHANAGRPSLIDGKDVFPETPEDMAKAVPEIISAGANIIGGCCGTTPEHIRAIKEKIGGIING